MINCAAYNVLWPIYAKSFYEHSYGSIPGMGQIKATQQLQYGSWCEQPGKMVVPKASPILSCRLTQLRELGKPLMILT